MSRSSKNRKGTRKKHPFYGFLIFLAVVGIIIGGGAISLTVLMNTWLKDLPDYSSVDSFNIALPTTVYASDGTTELARFELENRDPVDISEISQYVIDATVATEDERFYEHNGVDPTGIIRAFVNNITGGEIEGASTITQQFVRNTVLSDEMNDISLKRKVREAYIAIQIEKMYTKDEILELYLNTINYGGGAYGIEAASQHYFSKHASELTLAEAATLVGIPQSPTYNDPTVYPENALSRRNVVLERMLNNGYITQEEYNSAVAEPLVLNVEEEPEDGILAYPYFTSYVRDLLYNQYDFSEADVLKGGMTVITTLDVDLQEKAENACQEKRDSMSGNMEVAMAVVDPDNGNIKAIVGGSDYSSSQVNLATGTGGGGRPCGSSFKAYTLVTAIKQGINPNTTYVDCSSPATVDGYTLENYGNTNYGTRTIASAFAVSSNTGFVRLISAVGVEETAQTAYDLGVTTDLNADEAGAALTLGTQNITPLDLANSYATIANGGTRHTACAIETITDRDGNIIVDERDETQRATRVISSEVAYAATRVMEGVITSGTGTAANLANGQVVAGKTGTSEDYKDITFVGFTPQYSVAIWIGDPTNETSVPTGTAADCFKWFMDDALAGTETEDFPTANEPSYTTYSNSKYHIYSSYTSSSSSSSSSSAQGTTNNSESSTSNSTSGSTGSSTGSNTADGGGESTSGGSSSSGSTSGGSSSSSGSSSGGTSGGGSSGGGTAGGGTSSNIPTGGT